MKLAAWIKVRCSLKLRVVIAQFQTNAQRVEKELKNFIFFVCLVYKNYKWTNQSLCFYCIINLPRTAELKSGLSAKKQRLYLSDALCKSMCYLNLAWRHCLANQIWIIDYCIETLLRLKIHNFHTVEINETGEFFMMSFSNVCQWIYLSNFVVIAGPYLPNRKQLQSCILEISFRKNALFNLLFEK